MPAEPPVFEPPESFNLADYLLGDRIREGRGERVALRLADRQVSYREVQVLALVAEGATNKEIGKHLHVSEATVKSHLLHIFGKLGVADRTAAVTTALKRGMLRLDS